MFNKWFGFIFILLSLCALTFLSKSGKKAKQKALERKRREAIVLAAKELSRAWVNGRHERDQSLSCPQFFFEWPLPPEALKCNPLFLKCLFEKKPLNLADGRKVSFLFEQASLPYKIVSKSLSRSLRPGYALEVWIEADGERQRVWLEDTCSSIYLPQRVYGYGKRNKKKEDFLWDNFDYHWFIDRRQVTHREVLEWLEQTGKRLKEKVSTQLKNHYRPVGSLYPEEMRAYCQFRGKQLAQAHLLDAAFFLPGDIANPLPKIVFRGPYPWRRSRSGSFLAQLKSEKEKKIEIEHCLKIPGRECQNRLKPFEEFSSSSTWSGVFQALGGLPEFVLNPLHPRRNVNISGYYFPLISSAHEIGQRVYWDGLGFHRSRFSMRTFALPRDVNRVQVGFRCMKKRKGIEKF